MPASDPRSILADDLLEVLNQRASRHDAENSFPTDDLEALRDTGYLRLLVPRDFGGTGASLEQTVKCQARLAAAAPATALAVNMHHVVSGIARSRHESGDDALDWMLREIVAGRPTPLRSPRLATTRCSTTRTSARNRRATAAIGSTA